MKEIEIFFEMDLETAVAIVDQAMQSRGVDVRKAWGIVQAKLEEASNMKPDSNQPAPCISCAIVTTNVVRLCKSCEGNFE